MNKAKVSITACALLAVFAIWFTWIYEGFRYSYSEDENYLFEVYEVDELLDDVLAKQTFVARERYLKGTAFYLINLPEDRTGSFNVELCEKDGKTISTISHRIEDWTVDEWEWFDFDERLKPGREYEFKITLSDYSGRVVPFLIRIPNNDKENNTYYQSNEYEGSDQCTAMRFRYAIPASAYEKLAYTLLLAVLICITLIKTEVLKVNDLSGKVLAGLSILALFVLYVPNIAYKLKYINLDDSWRYALNLANPRGYTFGKDIIFTYGPLGYLCYMMNLPENKAYFVFGVILWSVIIAGFIYLLIKLFRLYIEGHLSLVSIVLSFVVAFASYKVLERDNFLLYLVILAVTVYELESRYKEKPSIPIYIITNAVILVMYFAKFSTFSSSFAFMFIYVIYRWIFLKNWKGVLLFVPGMIAMPFSYLIYNPSVKEWIAYVVGFVKHSNDWMESWQYDVTVQGVELFALIVIMVLYASTVVIAMIRDYRKSGVLIALCASMFFVYKYATTRHGLPCGIWLFGMLYSVVPLNIEEIKDEGAKSSKLVIPLYLFIIITGLLEANVMHNTTFLFKDTLKAKIHNWTHLSEAGIEDTIYDYYWEIPEGVLQTIGDSTVCVYPYNVSIDAIYPELNIIYYPTITNGEASEWSDRMVANWFASESAAEYMLLDDDTVDDHIKYLENPLTWKAIENNYSLIGRDGDHCILKKNEETGAYERPMKLISSEEYAAGDEVIVPEGADYVKIITDYSLAGKLKKFFYHVGTLNMSIRYDDETGTSGRVLRQNLITGFELCEYPQNTDEFVQYMLGNSNKRIESLRLYGLGISDLNDTVCVEWYSFE